MKSALPVILKANSLSVNGIKAVFYNQRQLPVVLINRSVTAVKPSDRFDTRRFEAVIFLIRRPAKQIKELQTRPNFHIVRLVRILGKLLSDQLLFLLTEIQHRKMLFRKLLF